MKWISSDKPLAMRLIAFGLVEGLFFAGSFCAIYYFRKRGLLAGLAASNDLIARDEGLHFSFSALLFKTLGQGKVTQQEFEEICREAVSIEKEFVTEALPVDLIGMNAELMCQYIEHTADVIAGLFVLGSPRSLVLKTHLITCVYWTWKERPTSLKNVLLSTNDLKIAN